ncbi:MAG: putative FAD-dependent dehydrogenase [Verrucomicrobiales bacterium]|jgi:uncharacterized FAD-dependent dehydrogenase
MIQIRQLKLPVGHDEAALQQAVLKSLRVPATELLKLEVFRRSPDARKKDTQGVVFIYTVNATVSDESKVLGKNRNPNVVPAPDTTYQFPPRANNNDRRPVIIGTGPCGLFAGLLLAMQGRPPLLIERGKMTGPRARDVTSFWRGDSDLDPDSNVQYGEGGAGTFSDGKLYTGIKDRQHRIRWILGQLTELGAPDDILTNAKPHIGTDRLIKVVRNLREKIISLGGEFKFETRLTDILVENGKVRGLTTHTGEEIETDQLILAIGHSARDTFEMLHEKGIAMEAKPFSIGARIEHPQKMIDRVRYGKSAGHPRLGSAAYKFAHHYGPNPKKQRAAYSFCMCPGGLVVAAASEPGHVVTNGMSSYQRDEANANAGFMIDMRPNDYGGSDNDPLAGLRFQRKLEAKAYQVGGANNHAPAQLVGDLLAGRASTELGKVEPSYRPGVTLCDIREILPDFVTNIIKRAIPRINREIPGFDRHDAVLTAVETRSSSPLRITRDNKTLESENTPGLYPAGEGAGYAGGIVSAAADGLKVAEAILNQ